ncbi:hypothetical protein [Pseudanabaena sp. FACHB-2040]|uniref:hypothetical protein n=1 Tax=Pseudanabaena sp. FACHB-2040 TaxID=2692859 RepID=UPI00168680A0|nr:hypothetical protein [Pseudanabaena sp. FACHB-2040]MBD2256659.1 hypothetical protein [Pseudanabaena sp. FACHB-2040]
MTTLDEEQREQILLALGYPDDLNRPNYLSRLTLDYTDLTIERIDAIFDELKVIDGQLTEARSSSMAAATGRTQLQWGQHVMHLRGDGHNLLRELAIRAGIPLHWSKYSQGQTRHTVQYQ